MTQRDKQNSVLRAFDEQLKMMYGPKYSGMEDGDGGRMTFTIIIPVHGKMEFEYHRSRMNVWSCVYGNESNYDAGCDLEERFNDILEIFKKQVGI